MAIKNKLKMLFLMGMLSVNLNVFSKVLENKKISVASMENKDEQVNVSFDYVHMECIFSLSSSKAVCVNEFTDLGDSIEVLDNHFIAFNYIMRGGSGVKMHRTILLCISNGNFLQPLMFFLWIVTSLIKLMISI
jgi:hypothetical protein